MGPAQMTGPSDLTRTKGVSVRACNTSGSQLMRLCMLVILVQLQLRGRRLIDHDSRRRVQLQGARGAHTRKRPLNHGGDSVGFLRPVRHKQQLFCFEDRANALRHTVLRHLIE